MSARRHILSVGEVKDHVNEKVNLIAVVTEFSIPRKSNGTDYCTILKVIDQSQQGPELSVHIFVQDIHQLPHIRSRRDIIFLARVRIEDHSRGNCAIFNKKYSSFALFAGTCSSDFSPYQTYPTFCLQDHEEQLITGLRSWTFQLDEGTSEYLVSFKDIRDSEFVDLVCKLLGVYKVSSDKWMLYLWDGTDVPMVSLDAKVEDKNLIRLQVESAPLPTHVLAKFPCVGTVLRVIADRAYENLGHHFQFIGNWVKIRNVQCETDSGLWKGFLNSRGKIRLLSENDNIVGERERAFADRLSRWGRVPMSSSHISKFLTVTDYGTSKCATLMDLLTFSNGKGTFKCVVRIVAIYPWQAKDFQSPKGQYRIRVVLEDPTARISALLLAEDAEMFFGGYPSVDAMATNMNKLLGVLEGDDNSPRNPPWIQCCIEVHNETGNSGTRHFHIRSTRMVIG